MARGRYDLTEFEWNVIKPLCSLIHGPFTRLCPIPISTRPDRTIVVQWRGIPFLSLETGQT
jgi:hypothetical protein